MLRGSFQPFWAGILMVGALQGCSVSPALQDVIRQAWAAQSIRKVHTQLAPMHVAHVTRVEGPDDGTGERQLTLT